MIMKRLIVTIILLCLGLTFCLAQGNETIRLPEPRKTGGMPLMEALQKRQSLRLFSDRELSPQQLSDLLWAAFGVNRDGNKRTAPSAHGWNETDIYIVKADGWYVYDPVGHALMKGGSQDMRQHSGSQDFVRIAPVSLIYVADFDRMTGASEEDRKFYSAADAGFIAQNVYLFCASEGLATVVRGMVDKTKAREVFRLKDSQHVVLAQTIGFPAVQP